MHKAIKKWWRLRHAKHYVNNHWHLIADILLLCIILGLVASLIIIKYSPAPQVNVTPIDHVAKDIATSTIPGSLVVNSKLVKSNIYLGQAFNLKISLENSGNSDIKNLQITPQLSSGFIISKIENANAVSLVKVVGGKLILENLAAGETQEADIWLTVKDTVSSARSINLTLKAIYQEAGRDYVSDFSSKNLKIITDLKIKAEAYYNSPLGDQLGSGPVPPILGFPTNYWIFFEVDNLGNDLSGVSVNAKLPEGVTLASRKTLSAGEFNYDESQKRLTWTIKTAPQNNGLYQVGFEVQLMAIMSQVNTNPLLVSNISYLATDTYTGEKLSGSLASLDTSLPLDTINRGQGIVVK